MQKNRVLNSSVAFLIAALLLLTTTLGLVAVKQQQFAEFSLSGSKGGSTSFFLPFDISRVNPGEETKNSDFLKILLKNAVIFTAFMFFRVITLRICQKAGTSHPLKSPAEDKVVLLE